MRDATINREEPAMRWIAELLARVCEFWDLGAFEGLIKREWEGD